MLLSICKIDILFFDYTLIFIGKPNHLTTKIESEMNSAGKAETLLIFGKILLHYHSNCIEEGEMSKWHVGLHTQEKGLERNDFSQTQGFENHLTAKKNIFKIWKVPSGEIGNAVIDKLSDKGFLVDKGFHNGNTYLKNSYLYAYRG